MINCVRCGRENERQICEACMEKRRRLRFLDGPAVAAVVTKAKAEIVAAAIIPAVTKRKPGRPRKSA